MDDLRKAAEMALEALILLSKTKRVGKDFEFAANAATALRQALAQPEQEPFFDITAAVDAAMVEMKNLHPPMRRSECERLIKAALYTVPPSKPWVSLTDADIASLENIYETHGLDVRNIAQIIDSLLRERNT